MFSLIDLVEAALEVSGFGYTAVTVSATTGGTIVGFGGKSQADAYVRGFYSVPVPDEPPFQLDDDRFGWWWERLGAIFSAQSFHPSQGFAPRAGGARRTARRRSRRSRCRDPPLTALSRREQRAVTS